MINVAIVGAGGYSGAELAGILLGHPHCRIVGVFASAKRDEGTQAFSSVFPRFRGRLDLPLLATDVERIAGLGAEAVFLCTPHEASLELGPQLLAKGLRVFDLSAAFRLKDASLYPKHYGFEHTQPGALGAAVYGLPELFREQMRGARLVAVPGCYPTSAILPLAPLARAGAIAKEAGGAPRRVIIDSTSGVSGAGRSPALKSLFCEVSQSPYNVLKHRHNPEIDAYAGTRTLFTPHLGPYERGILSTIHVDLAEGWTRERVGEVYGRAYARERFVRLLPEGAWPSVADVARTNFCDIAWAVEGGESGRPGHLVVCSAIDNLVKGAAGQAVQGMNVVMGVEEGAGL